jgi:Chaperone of endosialidase
VHTIDGSGNAAWSGAGTFGNGITVTGGLRSNGGVLITTSGNGQGLNITDGGGNGAGLVLSGANGAKFLRVNPNPGAVFEMLNNAFNTIILSVNDGGLVAANVGYNCKNGSLGGFGPNSFNWFYSAGQNYSFVDNSNLGYVTLNSDERIKKDIAALDVDVDAFMNIETIIYKYNGAHPLWPDNGVEHWGFSVQNLLAAGFKMATDGDVDELDLAGEIQPARIDTTVLLAMLYNVVRKQEARIRTLEGADIGRR